MPNDYPFDHALPLALGLGMGGAGYLAGTAAQLRQAMRARELIHQLYTDTPARLEYISDVGVSGGDALAHLEQKMNQYRQLLRNQEWRANPQQGWQFLQQEMAGLPQAEVLPPAVRRWIAADLDRLAPFVNRRRGNPAYWLARLRRIVQRAAYDSMRNDYILMRYQMQREIPRLLRTRDMLRSSRNRVSMAPLYGWRTGAIAGLGGLGLGYAIQAAQRAYLRSLQNNLGR